MKKLFERRRRLWIMLLFVALGSLQQVSAQSSHFPDSMGQVLTYFYENTKDERLRKALKEVQINYAHNNINNSLAAKLLYLDSLLVNSSEFTQQKVVNFNQTLVQLFAHLSPKEKHPAYAKSLHHLAFLYESAGIYDKSLFLYQKTLAITKRTLGEKHPAYAASLNGLASLYERMGEYQQALSIAKQASAIIRKDRGKENADFAHSLTILAVLYEDMGQHDKMLPLVQQALAIRKKVLGEEHPAYAESLGNLADLYEALGLYDKALPLYKMDSTITRKVLGEDHPDYAFCLNNLAFLYEDMGRYDRALPLYQQALAIRKKVLGEEHPHYATSLNNLASVYRSIGQYQIALGLYQKDSAITRRVLGERHPDYALSLNNLAHVFKEIGKYELALPLVQQALEIQKNALGENDSFYATYLKNLAGIYYQQKQYDKTLSLLEQKLNITRKAQGEQHPEYGASLSALADFHQSLGRNKESLPLYLKAMAIYKISMGEEHPEYTKILNNLGLLYLTMGNDTEAASLLTKASTLKLQHLKQTYTTLSEQEKLTLINQESNQFSYLFSLLFTKSDRLPSVLQQVFSNELVLKGMVLKDQHQVLKSIRQNSDSQTLRLYDQWQFNKAFIGKQLLYPIKERVSYLDSLTEVNNHLEQQLSRNATFSSSQQQAQKITAQDITYKLTEGQAVVEFVKFPLYNKRWTDSIMYAALVLLPGDSVARFIPLFEEKQLKRLLQSSASSANTYRNINKLYSANSKARESGDSLYYLLWRPLEKQLKESHTVYYAPTGLLHRIAFQALRFDSSHFLIDKYQLNQVLSSNIIALSTPVTKKPTTISVWGDITYSMENNLVSSRTTRRTGEEVTAINASSFNFYTWDTKVTRGSGFGPLPGTKQEIDGIKKICSRVGIPITIKTGTGASEEAFKALNGNGPPILHVATHGFFLATTDNKTKDGDGLNQGEAFKMQSNPMFRSGLVLAGGNHTWTGAMAPSNKEDGILTAYEIAQMDLSNTDLVVLSACATALGDLQGNEGAIGLQRAFKIAGVKQLIISLWPVPDKETAELMTLFYTNWLSGKSIREALKRAQLQIKIKESSPFYWAGFVILE